MAKSDDNFLRGWCRQVRHALDEGTELGYEAAELLEELSELLSPGDTDPEMGQSDGTGGGGVAPPPDVPPAGSAEADLAGVPRVGGSAQCVRVTHRNNDASRVPRGTGDAAVLRVGKVTRG